jgi:hypothetical protein
MQLQANPYNTASLTIFSFIFWGQGQTADRKRENSKWGALPLHVGSKLLTGNPHSSKCTVLGWILICRAPLPLHDHVGMAGCFLLLIPACSWGLPLLDQIHN